MSPRWPSAVISGASRGLGAAMARQLAGPGVRLLLVARSAAALEAVAADCAARGARAEAVALDVRDPAPLAAALERFAASGPVELAVANAGTSAGTAPDGTPEDTGAAARQVAVNLLGAMHLVGPLLPAMRARGAGRVVLVASLAALRGLPDTPGYCASKAGLAAWGEALRAELGPRGVGVTVALPGFFDSAMGARLIGPRPLALPAEAAAARILAAAARGRGRVAFPGALAFGLRAAALLPPVLGDRATRLLRFRVRPEG